MAGMRRIGPYEIIRVLDAGGMGKVYLARETEGVAKGRLVVVKTIRSELEKAPEHVESFQREARLLAHIRHSNIVQLYDAGRVGERLYMAMEYLEGLDVAKTLKLLTRRQVSGIPLEVVMYVGIQVALALDGAHHLETEPGKSAGLVHRDLSPHNIFLLYSGGVKILDFGLARAYGEVGTTRTGTVKGKFRYLAPEQARGEELDCRVDIFSLGLVMHEMLSGQRAYDVHGDVDVLRAAMEGKVKRLRDMDVPVPEPLLVVIERMLAADRDQRFPNAIAVAEALQSVALELSMSGDLLSLRRFMEQMREWVGKEGVPTHTPLDEEDEEDWGQEERRPSASYLPASAIASVADVQPPPAVPTPKELPGRWLRWGMIGLAALGAGILVSFVAMRGVGTSPASSTAQLKGKAVMVAPAVPMASASAMALPSANHVGTGKVVPEQPSAAVSASAPPNIPQSHPTWTTRGGTKHHRIVKPKQGVGTGVIADYP
jgi:eukaryotic-like serine/threonine-protein kinase